MVSKILKWGIYIVVFILPLYLVRFEVFGIPTTVLELMIYALFAVWLVKKFNFSEIEKTIKENRSLFVAVFLILIGASLATLRSWDLRLSAGILKAWFFDPLLFFVVFISIIKSSREIKNVFCALASSGFVVSVVSLIYLFLGKLNIDGRLQGFYDSPNYLAMYLAPILVLMFGALFLKNYSHENTRRSPSEASRCASPSLGRPWRPPCPLGLWNVFLVGNFLLTTLVLFFTKSFGAWMGMIGAIGLGLIVWFLGAKKKKIAIILAILLIILCVGIYFLKFSSTQGRLSINSRLEIWQRAIDAVVMYPIIGIGPGTFKNFFPSYPLWGVPQPHNLYLAFLLQTGVVGFIGLTMLLIWFFKTALRSLKTNYSLLIALIMIYVLIHGLVDTTYWKNDLAMMFWIIVGMMVIINRLLSNGNEARIV
jgi:O-antigen ligase